MNRSRDLAVDSLVPAGAELAHPLMWFAAAVVVWGMFENPSCPCLLGAWWIIGMRESTLRFPEGGRVLARTGPVDGSRTACLGLAALFRSPGGLLEGVALWRWQGVVWHLCAVFAA